MFFAIAETQLSQAGNNGLSSCCEIWREGRGKGGTTHTADPHDRSQASRAFFSAKSEFIGHIRLCCLRLFAFKAGQDLHRALKVDHAANWEATRSKWWLPALDTQSRFAYMKRTHRYFYQVVIGISAAALIVICTPGCEVPAQPVDLNPATLAGLEPTAKSGGPQVYLLRGLADIYSVGLNILADKMVAQGIPALATSGPSWPTLAAAIEQAYADGSWQGDLVLVGHSYGSDNAIRLATELDTQDIPVRLLLLLDATDPPPIPKNVDRCVHYYIPTIFAVFFPDQLPGNPVQAAAGNDHTEIVNIIVQDLGAPVAGLDHFSIDSSDYIHELCIEEVLKLTPSQP